MLLSVNNVEVEVSDVLVSQAEGDVLWSASMVLESEDVYALFVEGVLFEIDFMGEHYLFQYTGKSIQRSGPGEAIRRIDGRSPAVMLQEPRATLIDVATPVPIAMRVLIENVLGEEISWMLPDWTVEANRVAASQTTPLRFAVSVLDEVGAVLECEPNGSFVAREKYKVPSPGYGEYAADHTYSDSADNLSVDEQYEPREGYNKFRVSEFSTEYSDRIELVMDEGSSVSGTLKVYPSPWRSTFLVRTTKDGGPVVLRNVVWETREEVDTVEFVKGVASLPYPAEAVLSIVWMSDTLGGLVHEPYTSELSAPTSINEGYGLAKITYRVNCATYRTSAPENTVTQYVVEEV